MTGRWPVTFLLVVIMAPPSSAQCPDGSPPPCARAAPAPPRSIAVLTFANLRRDTAIDYLAEGLADAIYTRLRQVGGLTLTSRTMVRRFPGADTLAPAALGHALGAGYLVNGTVRAAAGRLRVSVECLRAADGRSVWASDFEGPQADLLTIEEDIAVAVASEVAGQLEPAARRVLTVRPTTNATAYDLFYRGNYDLAQRTEASVVRARLEYASAHRLDPHFAAALAREAYTYGICLDWDWGCREPAETLVARGRALAQQAVREAPRLSDSWMAEGYMLYHRYARMSVPTADTMRAALDALRRAVMLDSTNAEAWHQYAGVLSNVEQSQARAAYQRALVVDPARGITLAELAVLELVRRQLDSAELLADSVLVLQPSFRWVLEVHARVRVARGDATGAIVDARASGADWLVAGLTRDSALVALRCRGRAIAWGQLNCLMLAGWKDTALVEIEATAPSAVLYWTLLQPELDPLRGDPRFERAFAASRLAAEGVLP